MAKNVQRTGASVYYVDPAQYLAQIGNMPAYDPTDLDWRRTAFDALFTSNDFGALSELAIAYSQDNEEKIYSMNCNDNLFLNTSDKKANISWVMLENVNIDVLATLLGADRQSLLSAPINVSNEAKGTWRTVWSPIKVNNKNADNTQVTSLVVEANAVALVLNTDYTVYVGNGSNGALWFTYVVPVTAQATAITFDYTYVPADAEFMWIQTRTGSVPVTAYKIVSCPFQDETDTVTPWRRLYIRSTSCSLTGELAMQFFKQGDSFEWISFEVQSDGWVVVTELRKGATQSSV